MSRQHIYLSSNRSPKPREQRFNVSQPAATHHGWVSCKDYDCEQFINGWALILPQNSSDALYIRSIKNKEITVAVDNLGREIKHSYWFNEEPRGGGLVCFIFPPGQPCFRASKHRWIVRPPIWIHDRNEMRRVLKANQFMETFNEEGYKINRALERG